MRQNLALLIIKEVVSNQRQWSRGHYCVLLDLTRKSYLFLYPCFCKTPHQRPVVPFPGSPASQPASLHQQPRHVDWNGKIYYTHRYIRTCHPDVHSWNYIVRCPMFNSSHCNPIKDRAPIFGCPIFKWVAGTWVTTRQVNRIVVPAIPAGRHASIVVSIMGGHVTCHGRIIYLLHEYIVWWPPPSWHTTQ